MDDNKKIKSVIMAVDDDSLVIYSIKKALEEFSETSIIYCFQNSIDFVDAMSKDVDLVILDINMPNHDIYVVMKHIEAINPFALVTLLTASTDNKLISDLKSKYNRIRSSINKNVINDEQKILDKGSPIWSNLLKEAIREDLEIIKLIK